jgi:hypothetical protein
MAALKDLGAALKIITSEAIPLPPMSVNSAVVGHKNPHGSTDHSDHTILVGKAEE